MKSPTLMERFESKIERVPESGCWIWMGALRHLGYGQVFVGREEGRNVPGKAHRVAYELFVGPVPDGMLVCHRCDIPACVNPAHLFLGTNADNVRDMWNKGRGLTGQQRPNALLNDDRAREIVFSNEPGKTLAERYKVAQSTVSQIRSRKAWKALTMDGVPIWIDGETMLAELSDAMRSVGLFLKVDSAGRMVASRVPAFLKRDADNILRLPRKAAK